MPSYKLTYFDLKGLGENIRLLFTYGNEEFEDNRLSYEEWPNLKPSTPFGVIPTLEIDGKMYHQSIALSRYLGRKYGLAGSNDLEALEVDQIVDTLIDFKLKFMPLFLEKDEEKKKALLEELSAPVISFYLDKFEAIAAENNGHLALGKLTWADFLLASIHDGISKIINLNIHEKYPNLKNVIDNVLNLPAIQKFYENAPTYEF